MGSPRVLTVRPRSKKATEGFPGGAVGVCRGGGDYAD